MKERRRHGEKSTERPNGDGRSPYPGKRIYTSADVVRPNFGGQSKLSEASIAPTHEQIAKKAYRLWQQKGCPLDKEEECWLQAEAELKNGDLEEI
jgi:hypothetical protein